MIESAARIAIIGGTGLNQFSEGITLPDLATPFGKCSAPLVHCEVDGRELVFLARHGSPHSIAPHNINYRANLWALKKFGVTKVLAVNAVGGIRSDLGAGVIVLPDQLLDYSYGREHTFFDGERRQGYDSALQHIDFSDPFSEELRSKVMEAAALSQLHIADRAVYGVTQGPRLETAAEVNRLERDGCDIVGMTAMPEAALARELGLDYVSICLVVNPAAGRSDGPITMDDIHRVIDGGMIKVRRLLAEVLPLL